MAFMRQSSPHVRERVSTSKVMLWTILATIPGMLLQTAFFGIGSLIQVLLCVVFCLSFEVLSLKLRGKQPQNYLKDNSAILTGVLIGLALPALAPWWLAFIGCLFAIMIVKQLYGGIGNNLFNPAMAAYVLLLISFPVPMTQWPAASYLSASTPGLLSSLDAIFFNNLEVIKQAQLGFDGVSMATALDTLKTDLTLGLTSSESLAKSLFSNDYGSPWMWLNLAYLAGGIALIQLKVIRWHIPTAIIASLFFCSALGYIFLPDLSGSPIFHLSSGATMIAAFFIATDPVSAATSPKARLIYGALIGLMIYIIRTFGGYPDAVAFAVLLANICVPLIDYYVRPQTYGHPRD
ncbi:electron transport complex subunit RsxD [Paraferrimonas sp. SM1919]|uniref:electron transport complex subunit RsxD n=1 Tax=Paraferrimonas sp. SM1919 TaxID=2662263 RepID=UPI0013D8A8BF|nr:electron transport complex subunit RsxD [Paraferrimonas sp. SM1919]